MRDNFTIIWDWNGTLLNDIDICIDSINVLLSKYNKETISKESYKKIFSFPVQNYYNKLGFNTSTEYFKKIAEEFILEYNSRLPYCQLFPGVKENLNYFSQLGYTQTIISAMEQGILTQSVREKEIEGFFHSILGLSNNLAASKAIIAKNFIENSGLNPKKTWFIGDTSHDFEVSQECGCNHVLIANGHQNYDKLTSVTKAVVDELSKVKDFIPT
ncbi:MAG: HAD family hydrolase [Promethearchaeota archaeon]|jgi:phosphoglycolate phosphatase